jgi:hypothetical protein
VVTVRSVRHPRSRRPEHFVYYTAREALKSGISVVPIRADGSKQPALASWREYQRRRASQEEVDHWFRSGALGIAFITGSVSGNLEALDFDDARIFEVWLSRIEQDQALAALYYHLSQGYLEATPAGGRHLLYRCDTKVEGNQKLASRPNGNTVKTLIETRGEGGLIIVTPSHGGVHPSGERYTLLCGGAPFIRTITAHQRERLLAVAREFNEMPPVVSPVISPKRLVRVEDGLRPGDLFNQQASWEEVLVPHGWQLVRIIDGKGSWRRPGKIDPGISATTNYSGSNLLYVFSTSTAFEPLRGYNKFQAYTLLNHNGDFSAAARALVEQGYVAREATA